MYEMSSELDKRSGRAMYKAQIERLERARRQSEKEYEETLRQIDKEYHRFENSISLLLIFILAVVLVCLTAILV
jgi:hypothetical protein